MSNPTSKLEGGKIIDDPVVETLEKFSIMYWASKIHKCICFFMLDINPAISVLMEVFEAMLI